MKLHDILLAGKIVEKVINYLHSTGASGPDCILELFLKRCQPELSYVLVDLFNICLENPLFFSLLESLVGGNCV